MNGKSEKKNHRIQVGTVVDVRAHNYEEQNKRLATAVSANQKGLQPAGSQETAISTREEEICCFA
jgi:hypothetical protein